MLKKVITALLLAATLPTAALAADWWLVAGAPGQPDYLFYIDSQSIVTDRAGEKLAWELSAEGTSSRDFSISKSLYRFSCSLRTRTLVQRVNYDGDGRLGLIFEWPDAEQKKDHIVPGSIGESGLLFVCNSRLPSHVRIGDDDDVAVHAGHYFDLP